MALPPARELKVFYSYSHKDQEYRQQLETHLSNLKRLYHLRTWFDRELIAGQNWEQVIDDRINTADLIFLLISPDFMASDYCYNREMQNALARHAVGEVKVIPILIRRVHWANAPFSHLQLLPTDARPIRSWVDPDEAYYDIVLGVEKAIQDLLLSEEAEKIQPAPIATSKQKDIGYHEQMLRSYEKVIQRNPLDGNAYSNKGWALSSMGRFEEALLALNEAIRLDPRDASAYGNKGWALGSMGRFEETLPALNEAIRLDPNDTTSNCNKGWALGNLGRFEEALPFFDTALRFDPTLAVAYSNKGWALANLKRFQEALPVLEEATRLDPGDSSAFSNKGWTLGELKRFPEALSALNRAIQLDPTLAMAYNNKGWALGEMNRFEEALAALDEAINLDPALAIAYSNKSWALDNLNRSAEAQQFLALAKQLGL